MKIKPFLKMLWISFLSTFTLVLSQTLTASGFQDINTIRLSFLLVPIEYFIINFFVFAMLTILFIFLENLMPTRKLAKGILYSVMVSFIWVALKFQPTAFSNIKRYIFDSVIFMIPILIYGIFLGYLATEKNKDFKFDKRQIGYIIISVVWVLFHLIYVVMAEIAKNQIFNYMIWATFASIIFGVVFGFIYELSIDSKSNSLFVTSISVIVIFLSYYGYQYAINSSIDFFLLIKVFLDITSIILSIQFFEIHLNRIKKNKNENIN